MFDGPLNAETNGAEEIVELPARVAERADVADRTHRHVNQASRIRERLRIHLRLYDVVEDFFGRRLAGSAVEMRRVFATHPFETAVEHHLLHVIAAIQAIGKTAGRAKASRAE